MDKEIKTCSRCGEEKDINLFIKKRNICKSCISISQAKYRLENKEKLTKYFTEYRSINREEIREKDRIFYKLNSEKKKLSAKVWTLKNRGKANASSLAWAKRNLDKIAARSVRRRASKLQATPSWANDFFIKEAYHLAKIRTEITGIKWHVDHIVPLKSKIVCGLHCETNLQVIPATENLSKNNRYWPDMPEEK